MKHLTTYKIFESMFKLDTIANQFITDMSKVYNLRFEESFDKNKANCAWFTGEFCPATDNISLQLRFLWNQHCFSCARSSHRSVCDGRTTLVRYWADTFSTLRDDEACSHPCACQIFYGT